MDNFVIAKDAGRLITVWVYYQKISRIFNQTEEAKRCRAIGQLELSIMDDSSGDFCYEDWSGPLAVVPKQIGFGIFCWRDDNMDSLYTLSEMTPEEMDVYLAERRSYAGWGVNK